MSCLNEIFTAREAEIIWGLSDSTVRKALQYHRFRDNEYRKAGRITLITKTGMERLYGKLKEC